MEPQRINFTVSGKVYELLKEMAEDRGTTISNVLRDAIALENWFETTQDEGGKILVEKDGRAQEIIRRG